MIRSRSTRDSRVGPKSGIWKKIFEILASDADNDYAMIDSTIVRAQQHSARLRDPCALPCVTKGMAVGMERWVGLGVISDNLPKIGRVIIHELLQGSDRGFQYTPSKA